MERLIEAVKAICEGWSVRGWVRKRIMCACTSIENAMVIVGGAVIIVISFIGVIGFYDKRSATGEASRVGARPLTVVCVCGRLIRV